MDRNYDTVIGLEIHVQLNTASKAFSADKNAFIGEPNMHINPVSIALPGALPSVNRSHVISSIKLGLALDSEINKASHFDRKNYFYPDSPKGYQITQDGSPILIGGQFTFKTGEEYKTINIHHVHMEDDAGKSIHDLSQENSMIDLNRAGTPLLEIVTEPEFTSGQEVSDFIAALQILLRYLEISDANMEEGSLRCDCNVSVKPSGQIELGTRCEIKNINSKKFAKTAINYERDRQIKCINAGGIVDQETRLFDAKLGTTFTMRKKEDALDYRYFPDPDLQPIIIQQELIDNIKSGIGLLPWTAKEELITNGVSEKNAISLTTNKNFVNYFKVLNQDISDPKLVSDFVLNHLTPRWAIVKNLDYHKAKERWVEMLTLIVNKKVTASSAYQTLVPLIIKDLDISVAELAEQNDLLIVSESGDEIILLCQSIIDSNPDKVKAYRVGKKGLLGFFMGLAMRSGKNFDPKKIEQVFSKLLAD